jgi:hypothetical protein
LDVGHLLVLPDLGRCKGRVADVVSDVAHLMTARKRFV